MKIKFFDSIWWKLSLYFFGIIFLTLVSVSVGLIIAAYRIADLNLKKDAEERTHTIAAIISRNYSGEGNMADISVPLRELGTISNVSTLILDQNGKVLASSTAEWLKKITLTPEEIQRLKQGQTVTGMKIVPPPNNRRIYSASPVIRDGKMVGAVMTVVPLGQAVSIRRRFNAALMTSLIIAALISSIAAFFLARAITMPLRKMEEAADKIARGDFTTRIQPPYRDEIGALVTAFDDMSLKLKANIESRMRLSADVSHELRTPLATIQGCTEAIIDNVVETEEERKRYLETILQQTQRLSAIINDLMELSKFEAGEIKLELEPVEVQPFISSVVESAQILANRKGINLRKEVPPEPIRATFDRERMAQVFLNLINNAIQHNPAGTDVIISAQWQANAVLFTVSDTGAGIPKEELPHIFNRFHKADKSRSSAGSGSGLGLAIVKEIIEAHGSSIKAESSEKGTRFTFAIPYKRGIRD